MWWCFVPDECLADPLLVIHCSQRVCGCVLFLLNVWLILCLSLLALRMYVVVFVFTECLADPLLVTPCFQDVCGCILSLLNVWLIVCSSFLALRQYVLVFCPRWMSG
jgi:hypothetical protein